MVELISILVSGLALVIGYIGHIAYEAYCEAKAEDRLARVQRIMREADARNEAENRRYMQDFYASY